MKRLVALAAGLVLVPNLAMAQPKDPKCEGPYARYAAAKGPKAFAAGQPTGCGWQIKTESFSTQAAIRAQAIRQCAEFGGSHCRVIAEQK